MDDMPNDAEEPVPYMERTRHYYRALGYEKDYRWAQNDETPFSLLQKPLSQARIAIVVTSSRPGKYSDDNPPKQEVWSNLADIAPEHLYNQHLAWDKETTHTRDRESYLPLIAMQTLVKKGVIGAVVSRFHSVPTVYSQRETNTKDAPNILNRVWEDEADAVLLVPL